MPRDDEGPARRAGPALRRRQVDQLFCASHVNVVDRLEFCRSSSTGWVGAFGWPTSGSQYETLYVFVLGEPTDDADAAHDVLLGPGYVDENEVSAVARDPIVWPAVVPE